MNIYGFTGTSAGMKSRQANAVRDLLYNCDELHLGDCVGADAEAHAIAGETGIRRVGHPPINGAKRAYLKYEEIHSPKDYLIRNMHIAREGIDGLIATPEDWVEVIRGKDGGTWSTVRRARKLGRKIWIIRPDGSVIIEEGTDATLFRRLPR